MNKRSAPGFTMKEILASLPPEKRRADGTVTRFFHRPLSFPLSVVFLNSGFSPNGVTYLSILACAAAFMCTLFPSVALHAAAVALYLLFGTLDCVDGNMARALRNRKQAIPAGPAQLSPNMGEWVDALGGYCAYAFIVLSLGLSSALVAPLSLPGTGFTLPWGTATWILVASVASAANLLMRLAFQSWRVASGDASRSSVGSEKRFSEEIGITGWFQILYGIGLFTGTLPWLLLAYTAVYAGGCAVTILKLVLKVERGLKADH